MNLIFLVFILSIASIIVFGATISSKFKLTCRDEKGKAVDWFTIYKLPKQSDNPISSRIKEGSGYAYITENSQEWTLSSQSIESSDSMPGKTLDLLYKSNFKNSTKLGFILYNDQFGGKSLASRAHAKGVILFDDKSIVWIVHSIPNYPPKQSMGKYDIDEGQLKFGQSMMCLSLEISQLEKIGKQLLLVYPQIYDSFIPDSLLPLSNSLNLVYKGKRNSASPYSNIEALTTLGKNQFIALHKSAYFANDLYSELVAKYIKSSLVVEAWSNGVGTMESDCVTTFPVNNVDQVNFQNFKANFSVHSDHSKWALSVPTSSITTDKYLCIGDINRQSSQFKRGGGTLCFKNNPKVWQAYYDIIDQVEPCANENKFEPKKKGSIREKLKRTKQTPRFI